MIRAAIVGIGGWGRNLVASVQGKSDAIRFVAGATRTPAKAAEFCRQQGIRLADYETLLKDSAIDAVVLATPHSQHCEQIVAAANAGKHVFVEKPLGLDARAAEDAVRACAERKVTLAVGYNWRFQPALVEAKRMLDDGRLGKLLHIEGNFCGPSAYRFARAHWRQDRDEVPAGGMTGRGVHVVDAMLYLAGSHVGSVFAQSDRLVHDYGVDDTTSMLFRFRSGATAYLGTVIATAETWRLQVFGAKGWVEVGDVEHLHTWEMKRCLIDPQDVTRRERPEVITFAKTSTERAELEHFAKAALERRPIAIPGGDEAHNVAVLEAILRSARDARRVEL
jgi:predicted dehydrogenase